MTLPRILGVDDNPINLLLLSESLKTTRCEFIGCDGGAEAIETLSAPDARIDLVLLDLMMPEVDGLAVLRFMRAHPSLASIPVIVQSGSSCVEDISATKAAGANDYLVKPLTHTRLIEAVRQFVAV